MDALTKQIRRVTHHCELPLVTGGRFQRIERTVVADLTFPVAVEVVGHHVEEIHVFHYFGDVISEEEIRKGRH